MSTITITTTTADQCPSHNHPYNDSYGNQALGSSTAVHSAAAALHRSISVADNASLESGKMSLPDDPLLLQHIKKSEEDIKLIRKNGGSRGVQKFYREQNNLIDEMLGPLNPESAEEEEKRLLKVCNRTYASIVLTWVMIFIRACSSKSQFTALCWPTLPYSLCSLPRPSFLDLCLFSLPWQTRLWIFWVQ